MHFSILSDLKKTTAVVESLSTTSTSLLQETGKTNSAQDINGMCDRSINNINPFAPDVPLYSDLLLKPSTHQNANKISYDPNINLDFEENSPFQEGFMSETFLRPDKSFFSEPKRAWGKL